MKHRRKSGLKESSGLMTEYAPIAGAFALMMRDTTTCLFVARIAGAISHCLQVHLVNSRISSRLKGEISGVSIVRYNFLFFCSFFEHQRTILMSDTIGNDYPTFIPTFLMIQVSIL